MNNPDDPAVYGLPIEDQLPLFIEQHRDILMRTLEGLSEQEARASLVPSRTTLLGLVKHATFVERVWFAEAVTGQPRSDLGIAAGPDESFILYPFDTVASVLATYRATVAQSRAAVAGLSLSDELAGNRRGPLPLRWVYLHVLRELAQHCGHAEILREQILSARIS